MRLSPTRLSLRARLIGLAALLTVVVVGGTTFLKNRLTEKLVEDEARDAARAAALGVAADLTDRDSLPTQADLQDVLAEFLPEVPLIKSLTVTRLDEDGHTVLHASTEATPHKGTLALAREAVLIRDVVVSPEYPEALHLIAVPLEKDRRPYGAVVVAVSFDAVERVRRQSRISAVVVALAGILVLTGLIDLLARRLVHDPLSAIRDTMQRASEGDLAARAPVERADELGALAAGLNAMLERMAGFNAELRREVDQATGELRQRNLQLVEGAQRLFAARRELARVEQLAVAGQMAASVAHQVGTPLNLISGYVQMILEDLPADSASAARLRTVREQIAKVTKIVQGLLDQARRPTLRQSRIAPGALVQAACELARPTLEAAGIVLETQVDPDLPAVHVDVGQVEQVLLNLITNSIDAMPGGGRLTLSARAFGSQVEFAVADTGHGIPKEHLGRIFDPLFTTKSPGKGTGLGLTITRDVVAAHGGSLAVASEPGHGTTVSVRLPTAALPQEAHA